MKKTIFLTLIMLFLIPLVSADLIIPTETEVYFEYQGQPVEENIEFIVKGYGYSYPPGFDINKTDYTPEEVYSFSATYNNYGEIIDEPYYINYRHIDYYELEGVLEGQTFVIKNISQMPTECTGLSSRHCELTINLDDAQWSDTIPEITTKNPETLWGKIICFFKGLFRETC